MHRGRNVVRVELVKLSFPHSNVIIACFSMCVCVSATVIIIIIVNCPLINNENRNQTCEMVNDDDDYYTLRRAILFPPPRPDLFIGSWIGPAAVAKVAVAQPDLRQFAANMIGGINFIDRINQSCMYNGNERRTLTWRLMRHTKWRLCVCVCVCVCVYLGSTPLERVSTNFFVDSNHSHLDLSHLLSFILDLLLGCIVGSCFDRSLSMNTRLFFSLPLSLAHTHIHNVDQLLK